MAVDFRVVSIGTLSRNPLWQEQQAVRTPHATCTLVSSGTERILVDPSLPGAVLDARLSERAGLAIEDITAVFLTTFRACHRMALPAFDGVNWYLHEQEKTHAREYLDELAGRLSDDDDQRRIAEDDLALLERCVGAPDTLADQVQLFPLFGPSAGGCGLLLTPPIGTVVIAGDAVISNDYLEQGRIWERSYDLAQANQALQDVLEIADVIVPGHDNVVPAPSRLV